MSSGSERTISSVLDDVVGNVQGIIRSEVRLAKTEMKEEALKAGKAAGFAGSGLVLAIYGVGFLLLTCLYALETAIAPWLSALIMTVLVGSGAAVLIKVGMKRMRCVDPRPDKTIDSIKENLEWAKHQTK